MILQSRFPIYLSLCIITNTGIYSQEESCNHGLESGLSGKKDINVFIYFIISPPPIVGLAMGDMNFNHTPKEMFTGSILF